MVDNIVTIQGVIRLFDSLIKPLKIKQDLSLERIFIEKFYDLLGFVLIWSIGTAHESDQRKLFCERLQSFD